MSDSVNIRELNDLIASKSNFVSMITQGMDQTIVGQKHLVDSLLIALLYFNVNIFCQFLFLDIVDKIKYCAILIIIIRREKYGRKEK